MEQAGAEVIYGYENLSVLSEGNMACIADAINTIRPHVIHLNTSVDRAAAFTANLMGVPVVQHARLHAHWYEGHHILRSAARIVAVSEVTRRSLLKLDVRAEKISVIPDAIDVAHFNPQLLDRAECRARLKIPAEAEVLVMIARARPFGAIRLDSAQFCCCEVWRRNRTCKTPPNSQEVSCTRAGGYH